MLIFDEAKFQILDPMKQNLTRKPVISRFFSVTDIIPVWLGKTGINALIFL